MFIQIVSYNTLSAYISWKGMVASVRIEPLTPGRNNAVLSQWCHTGTSLIPSVLCCAQVLHPG